MSDATAGLFAALGRHAGDRALRNVSGTVRFELEHDERVERWLVRIDKGDVSVSRKNAAADCVVRADRALFERIVAGEANAFTAMLRGELVVEGDFRVLLLTQRLLLTFRDAA
jgi:putative sterol carrier protein